MCFGCADYWSVYLHTLNSLGCILVCICYNTRIIVVDAMDPYVTSVCGGVQRLDPSKNVFKQSNCLNPVEPTKQELVCVVRGGAFEHVRILTIPVQGATYSAHRPHNGRQVDTLSN